MFPHGVPELDSDEEDMNFEQWVEFCSIYAYQEYCEREDCDRRGYWWLSEMEKLKTKSECNEIGVQTDMRGFKILNY